MHRKPLLAVLLAVTLVLAGCSGTTSQPTLGPGPNSGTPTSTPDGNISYPDGAGPDGVNATALADTHQSALGAVDYRVTLDIATSGGSFQNTSRNLSVRSNLSSAELFQVAVIDTERVDGYRNTSATFLRRVAGGNVSYRVTEPQDSFEQAHRSSMSTATLQTVLTRGRFTANGTVQSEGVTYIRYDLTGVQFGQQASETTIDDASGGLLVTPEGVVTFAAIDLTGTQSGSAFSYEITYRVPQVGSVPVEKPGWLDAARDASSA